MHQSMAGFPQMIAEQRRQELDKRQVRQHFTNHAEEYNRYALIQKRVVRRLVRLLSGRSDLLTQGLEVGSGTGLLGARFGKYFPDADLVMSDIAHGMSCHSRKVLPCFPVCDADASALPFSAASFDFLISSSVYQWVEDLPAAFDEAARVLQPGGVLGLALFGEKTLFELKTSHQQALSGKASHVQSFPAMESVKKALGELFTIEELFSEDETEWHCDVPELLRNLKRIGAQNSSAQKPQGLASRRVMQKMFDIYRNEFKDQRGIPATYQVIYLLARKTEG